MSKVIDIRTSIFTIVFISILSLSCKILADVRYTVEIHGVEDKCTRDLLREVSHSVTLQNKPAASLVALRLRAETDIERLLQGLHARAYFEAEIDLSIEEGDPAIVIFQINTGPVYPLKHFYLLPANSIEKAESEEDEVVWVDEEDAEDVANEEYPASPFDYIEDSVSFLNALGITVHDLGVELGSPAFPQMIIQAEEKLIHHLHHMCFPLAAIVKRDIIADVEKKEIRLYLYVSTGPVAYFGPTEIVGNKKVCDYLIEKKIHWRYGKLFTPKDIECTTCALEETGLFRSVEICSASEINEDGVLPMTISLEEGQHRSIGAGLSYDTQQGAGGIAEWEHRNIRGMGEFLSLKTELMQKIQKGTIYYRKPDFLAIKQDLIAKMLFESEQTKGFDETSLTLTTKLSRELSRYFHFSYGVSYKYLQSRNSDNNDVFSLFKIPLQAHWNSASSPLDPTSGSMVKLLATPTFHLNRPDTGYYILSFDGAIYYQLPWGRCTVFATKMTVGSILGSSRDDIPPPERFYAGTPTTLRGYNYMTVSPLDFENKPIGGRSMLIFSFELRHRISDCWGGVLFYELGNVDDKSTPQFDKKQLGSAGFGARYYTAVGPLRFDFAFPLNRRKGVDKQFQFYFSIGQSF